MLVGMPEPDSSEALFLTRYQSRAVDRIAIEEHCFPSCVLMENAGRSCVDQLERLGVDGLVMILCGKGNNGGDGLVVARHLLNRGYECHVALADAAQSLAEDARQALEMLISCHVPILDLSGIHASSMIEELDYFAEGSTWLVDALLGTGATGRPKPPYDSLIDWMNAESSIRVALDLPSGLDCDTGQPAEPTFKASHTCTFASQKIGFKNAAAAPYLGEVHVMDIGIPLSVIEHAATLKEEL